MTGTGAPPATGSAGLLAAGRDCDVHALGEDRVVRRYRSGRSAVAEAATMRQLLSLGYPVPVVHAVSGPALVMDRVAGQTLFEAVARGDVSVAEAAGVLAGLHDELHRLPWPGAGPGESLLHLDLHPLNVLLSTSGPVVIDWSQARTGPAGLDVAMTALILAQAAVTPEMVADDPVFEDSLPAAARGLLEGFAARVTASFAAHVAQAVRLRQEDPNQSEGERALLSEAGRLALAAAPANRASRQ